MSQDPQGCDYLRALALSRPEAQCEHCRFWQYYCSTQGHCRRSPPKVNEEGETFWPETSSWEWCGEFQPKLKHRTKSGSFTTLKEMEREHIFVVLDHCSGNKAAAAVILGISLKTLYNKLNLYSAAARRDKDVQAIRIRDAEEGP